MVVKKVRQHQKNNGLAFGMNKHGFTLIEILVAIVIMGLLATILVPNLAPKRPAQERKEFVAQLNALVRLAWHNAISTHAVHKIVFDLKQERVFIEMEQEDKKDAAGEPLFKPLTGSYIASSMRWPADRYVVKNFFIEGFDEMRRFGGDKKTVETWFYIVPDGLTQEVTINLLDMNDMRNDKPVQVGLVLNPFKAQFTMSV